MGTYDYSSGKQEETIETVQKSAKNWNDLSQVRNKTFKLVGN